MRLFATVLCFVSIALNAAMGASSYLLFCEHESGDAHLVSHAQHAAESHLDACHSVKNATFSEHSVSEDCHSCEDTEIENKGSLDKASFSSERAVTKNPVHFFYVSFPRPCLSIPTPLLASVKRSRAPPLLETATNEYTTTIQFRL